MPPSPVDPVDASVGQVRAQMASLAAAASPSHPRRRLPRLPEAATTILKSTFPFTSPSFVCVHVCLNHPVFPLSPSTDFFFTKTRYPTTAQKDDLVAEIRAQFEGFEWYDRECLSRWFSGQRGLHGNRKEAGEGKAKAKAKERSHQKIKSDMIRMSLPFPLFPSSS
jgi:hypothetical protein